MNAREVESMLHDLLNNCRLDGECFWDGNETIIDSVTAFIDRYYPDAKLLVGEEDTEVKAAEKAQTDARAVRVMEELVPALAKINLDCKITNKGRAIIFDIDDYKLKISTRQNDKYTFYVYSSRVDSAQALTDFPGSEIPSFRRKDPDESKKKAMMGVRDLGDILESVQSYISKLNK